MPEMETLHCKAGHDFERPRKRGQKPQWCPEHHPSPPKVKPVVKAVVVEVTEKKPKRTLSEAHKKKLAEGRKAKAKQERKEGITRVMTFKKWLRGGPAPESLPTDDDFKAARAAGRIK